jgi:hypothetical protein
MHAQTLTPAEQEAQAKQSMDAIGDPRLGRKNATSDRENPAVRDAERHERQLEKGVEDSFPASDPPAATQPAKPPVEQEASDDMLDNPEKNRQLDEGLEESFPASDPASIVLPETGMGAPRRPPLDPDEIRVADFLKPPE